MKKKIAIVLAGCGNKDGAEITETVTLLVALSQKNVEYTAFAPDIEQSEVVNFLTSEPDMSDKRNVLREAARIMRGNILPLEKIDVNQFDAIVFAGGFGVAKNLTDFYYKGVDFDVIEPVRNAVNMFNKASKPIGAMCISPIILARLLGGYGVEITLGTDSELTQQLQERWGCKHRSVSVTEAVIDCKCRVVTTPAYMYDYATPYDISLGAMSLVEGVLSLIK